MAVSGEFSAFVIEQLEGLGPVNAKRMFGGAGLYLDGTIFAVLDDDVMYLKVDAETEAAFTAEDMGPFDPFGDGKRAIRSYRECPPRLLEDPDELCQWARAAWEAGRRADAAKRKKGKKKT